MTRDEKWGYAWYGLERLYKRARGEDGWRKMLSEQENFSKKPSTVFLSLFQAIQPDCAAKNIKTDILLQIIAEFEMSEFNSDPLNEMYVYSYMCMGAWGRQPIGERIASVRKNRRMSQQELAEKIGITQKDISRWENGERSPNDDSCAKLAEALNCSTCVFTYPALEHKDSL